MKTQWISVCCAQFFMHSVTILLHFLLQSTFPKIPDSFLGYSGGKPCICGETINVPEDFALILRMSNCVGSTPSVSPFSMLFRPPKLIWLSPL